LTEDGKTLYPIIQKDPSSNYNNFSSIQVDYSEEILANTLFKIITI